MTRSRLIQEPPDNFVDPEERTAEQELEAQGVKMEPLQKEGAVNTGTGITEAEWFERSYGGSRAPLGSKINLTKSAINIGVVAMEKLARDTGEEIKCLSFGCGSLDGIKVILIKVNAVGGYQVNPTKSKSGTIRLGSKSLSKKFQDCGLKLGTYRLAHKIKGVPGGWIAVPVEDG